MTTGNDKIEGRGCAAPPCSLSDCPGGDHMARLPYFREEPLPVRVDVWKSLDGKSTERTVSLKRGSISNRYLTDEELHGAEFFPANTEASRDEGGERL